MSPKQHNGIRGCRIAPMAKKQLVRAIGLSWVPRIRARRAYPRTSMMKLALTESVFPPRVLTYDTENSD